MLHDLVWNVRSSETKKEKNIIEWAGVVKKACQIQDKKLEFVAAGERFNARDEQYGINNLTYKIFEILPEAAKNYAARGFALAELKKSRANMVIRANAVAAAAAAVIPIPLADATIITALQVEMIIVIALIYGLHLDYRKALGLLGPALAYFAGPLAFQQLSKLIPGFGSVVGAGIAGVITLTMGMVFLHFFMHGNFKPSPEEVKMMLKKKYKEAKNYKKQLEKEGKRKNAGFSD